MLQFMIFDLISCNYPLWYEAITQVCKFIEYSYDITLHLHYINVSLYYIFVQKHSLLLLKNIYFTGKYTVRLNRLTIQF